MIRKEIIGDATLYLGDNAEIFHSLRPDAVVTDPPYGIGESAAKVASRGKLAAPVDYGEFDWDKEPASQEMIEAIRSNSQYQIVFGGNYFNLPPSSCWLVWDKQNGENDFADCELAWTNLEKAVRRIYWRWNGMIRKDHEERVHPTQKPLGVMLWCLSMLPPSVRIVCDPYMGSGSTGVACAKRGLAFDGIEKDVRYFDIACRRIEQAQRQGDLLRDIIDQKPPKQEAFL